MDFISLNIAADSLDDLERSRIANENRLRQYTRTEADSDGLERGFGLDETNPNVKLLSNVVESFKTLEHQATLQLQREFRKTSLSKWQKTKIGIGEKQLARLLAKIQDPYWNDLHERPRTVSELWAYSGLHVVDGSAAKRKKGVQSNWNGDAKMRAYLIATSCIKQMESPYRKVYDNRRKHTTGTHPDWSDGQSHNDALRIVSKQILKELWIESKSLRESK